MKEVTLYYVADTGFISFKPQNNFISYVFLHFILKKLGLVKAAPLGACALFH